MKAIQRSRRICVEAEMLQMAENYISLKGKYLSERRSFVPHSKDFDVLKRKIPEAVSIFILPPSRAVLEERLRARGTDSDAVITRRLAHAAADISHCLEFDYAVVNDRFEQAQADLLAIIGGRGAALAAKRPEINTLLRSLGS